MGIFTKKDTNTITGENKYKGWGNSKEKIFETETQKGVVEAYAGGDLKGKDFREQKKAINQQRRINERALRKAERKGIDPSQVDMRKGEYKDLSRRDLMQQQYYQDLGKERRENAGEIALTAAAIAATGGLLAPALLPGAGAAGAAGATATGTAVGTTTGGAIGTTTGGAGLGEGLRQLFKAGAKKAAKKAGEELLNKGIDAGVNALTQGGAQGAMQTDPRLAQLEQQVAQMQAGPMMMPQQPFPGYNQQIQQPQPYQIPPMQPQPSYTAGQVYDPFLGGYGMNE